MKIYVLIIVCFYTLGGLSKLVKSVDEEDNNDFFAALIKIVIGIIAIVFQSINL